MLDVNVLAKDKPHCDVRSVKVSPNGNLLAYAVDYSGDEVYELVVINLERGGEVLGDSVKRIAGSLSWGDDSTLFYLTQDAQLRPFKLWRHKLGTDASADSLLLEESDEQYWLGMGKTMSERFLLAETSSSETSEIHFLDLKDNVDGELTTLQPRTFGLRYEVEHDGGSGFLVWTNKDGAIDGKLMRAPIVNPATENWEEVIPYDAAKKIADVTVFKNHVVIEGREGGLTQLWLLDKDPLTGKWMPLHCVASLSRRSCTKWAFRSTMTTTHRM